MPSSNTEDLHEQRLQNRARRQRRWLLVGALWIITWATLLVNDLILSTDPLANLLWFTVFDLIASAFLMVVILPLAMIGRLLGNLLPLRPYRDHLTIGLPLLLCIAAMIPTVLDRIHPQRRFEKVTDLRFPADARILDYHSENYGLDHAFVIEFSASEASLIRLLQQLECAPRDADRAYFEPGKQTFIIPEGPDQVGVLLKIAIDWSTSQAVFEYDSY